MAEAIFDAVVSDGGMFHETRRSKAAPEEVGIYPAGHRLRQADAGGHAGGGGPRARHDPAALGNAPPPLPELGREGPCFAGLRLRRPQLSFRSLSAQVQKQVSGSNLFAHPTNRAGGLPASELWAP